MNVEMCTFAGMLVFKTFRVIVAIAAVAVVDVRACSFHVFLGSRFFGLLASARYV